MLEIIRPIVILIGLVLLETIPHYLHPWLHYEETVLKIVSGVVIFGAILLLDFIIRRGSSIRFIRSRRYPISHLEGFWFQHVSLPERPYSISRIDYVARGKWSYCGIGFNPDFTPGAEWSTESLQYDRKQLRWYFAGNASLLKLEAAAYRPGPRGYVTPIFELTNDHFSEMTRLKATVADLDVGEKRHVFTVTLIRADDLYPYGAPSIETLKEMSQDEIRGLLARKQMLPDAAAPATT